MVDLVGYRHADFFLFDAGFDNPGDVLVTRVGDDGLRIVVQLLLDRGDDAFQLVAHVLTEVEACEHFLIALKQLDRKPAALALLGHVLDKAADLAERVLDLIGKLVLCRRRSRSRSLFSRLHQLPGAPALERGGLNNRHAQRCGQLFDVDRVASLLDDVHHVERDDDRDAHFEQLGGEVQVALDVGGVDQVHDRIRPFAYEEIAGDDLLKRIRR